MRRSRQPPPAELSSRYSQRELISRWRADRVPPSTVEGRLRRIRELNGEHRRYLEIQA